MKLRAVLPLLGLSLIGATAGDAFAQEGASPAVPPPAYFPLMGPDGTSSSLNAGLAILTADGEDGTLKRLDLSAQYVAPSGLGGYASIAGSFADGDSHLGSLEVGGLWTSKSDSTTNTFRVGLVLPTASSDDDFFGTAFMHMIATAYTRPADFLTAAPETTTLRAAFTPTFRSDKFVARADLGVDIVLDTEGDGPETPYVHVDLGAGYDDGKWAALVELSTMAYLEEADDLLHVAALTGQLHAGTATPYLSLSKPIGDLAQGDDITSFTFGVRGRM